MFIGVAASQLNLATRTKTPRRQTKRRQQHAEAEEDELSQTAERCAGFFQGCVLALVPGAKRVSHRGIQPFLAARKVANDAKYLAAHYFWPTSTEPGLYVYYQSKCCD